MADIYGTDSAVGGTFRGNKFSLVVTGGLNSGVVPFEGALVQALQLSYQRQITRFWALGTRNQYYIEGRTEGQGQLSRVVGPQGLIDQLATVLADFCTVATRSVTLTTLGDPCNALYQGGARTSASSGLSLVLGGAISNGITLGADANSFIINSSVGLMFASLSKASTQTA